MVKCLKEVKERTLLSLLYNCFLYGTIDIHITKYKELGGVNVLIKQSRIRNLSKLNFIKEDSNIRIGVTDIKRFLDKLQEIGFPPEISDGQTVLPKAIGAVSRRNAEGDFIIHKDREKETHYMMREWTYNQWAGRGETREVTDSVAVPYTRYPRTIISPKSIELTAINSNCEIIIISPEIKFKEENEDMIIHIVNLFLEIFGECQVFDVENNPVIIPKLIKLNWEILPKGKMPWEKRRKQISKFIDRATGENKKVVNKRLKFINEYGPDFSAIGSGGFNKYIVFGFINKNIYVLESIEINNATYVLENDWETISKLTKAEILNQKFTQR